MRLTQEIRRQRDDLVRRAGAASTVAEVFATASSGLRALIPHDAAAWLMTDPATGLPTAPSRIEGFVASAEICTEHWRREFIRAHDNRIREPARTERPPTGLRAVPIDPVRR